MAKCNDVFVSLGKPDPAQGDVFMCIGYGWGQRESVAVDFSLRPPGSYVSLWHRFHIEALKTTSIWEITWLLTLASGKKLFLNGESWITSCNLRI